ncbi:MAG: thioredoxin family protein [Phycisphaerales bacterium]|nr:thioredoxin family protein [Phycisphaerales bacterium]
MPGTLADPTAAPTGPAPSQTNPVVVTGIAQKNIVRPGDQIAIAIVLDHLDGFHTWPNQDVLPSTLAAIVEVNKTRMALPETKPGWIDRFGAIQWPEPHAARVADPDTGNPIDVPTYGGRAIAYIPITISASAAAGPVTLPVVVSFQSCDDRACRFPEDIPVEVTLTIVPISSAEQSAPPDRAIFSGFDINSFATTAGSAAAATASKPIEFNIGPWKFSINPSGPEGIALMMLAAAVGGLLLNMTPCVLPVIPIKIMGLSQSAGDPRRCLLLGMVMSVGVIAFWLAMGVAISAIAGFGSISTLFQNSWFPIVVGAVIGVMALGMFNVFSVNLPKFVYVVNPKHDSFGGSFAFGIMTAILSTPCTAPVMGVAAAWAATQPWAVTMSVFGAIGAGMALPYLVLAANPRWVSKLPRTGPASELVKQFLGMLMLAVAAFFVGTGLSIAMVRPPDPASRIHWWVVAALVLGACVWLAVRTFQITKRPVPRVVFGTIALVLGGGSVLLASELASHGPVNWVYYTPERLDDAKREGKVVVVDFTAEWCLTCKALESGVLYRKEIATLLNDTEQVVTIKVDLSGNNVDGKKYLAQVGRVGIPLLVVMGPGLAEPIMYDNYTRDMVKDAIAKAAGPRTAAK